MSLNFIETFGLSMNKINYFSTIEMVCVYVHCYFWFPLVSIVEQFFLVVQQFFVGFSWEFEIRPLQKLFLCIISFTFFLNLFRLINKIGLLLFLDFKNIFKILVQFMMKIFKNYLFNYGVYKKCNSINEFWQNCLFTSTIASTGQASWQNPQYIHLVISISYLVVRLEPSARSSASIVIAWAGQIASHNLHAMHRSSPDGYLPIKINKSFFIKTNK